MAIEQKKLIEQNSARWAAMKVLPKFVPTLQVAAKKLLTDDAKAHFKELEKRTSVPWPVIAVIKMREAGDDPRWEKSIAQGDPWNIRSTHVPAGRGPFKNWYDAGEDALKNCAPFAARWPDWTPGGAVALLIKYNGLGYDNGPTDYITGKRYPPEPSPYAWAMSDQYVTGKFVADHKYRHDVVDSQVGAAPLLRVMADLDPEVAVFLGIQHQKETTPVAATAPSGGAGTVLATAGAPSAVPAPAIKPVASTEPVLVEILEGLGGDNTSFGCVQIAAQIRALGPNYRATVRPYTAGDDVVASVMAAPDNAKIMLVGYSNGASLITYAAPRIKRTIHKMIGLDPTFWIWPLDIQQNVNQAICLWNVNPASMFPPVGHAYYKLAAGNERTILLTRKIYDFHGNVDKNPKNQAVVVDAARDILIGA